MTAYTEYADQSPWTNQQPGRGLTALGEVHDNQQPVQERSRQSVTGGESPEGAGGQQATASHSGNNNQSGYDNQSGKNSQSDNINNQLGNNSNQSGNNNQSGYNNQSGNNRQSNTDKLTANNSRSVDNIHSLVALCLPGCCYSHTSLVKVQLFSDCFLLSCWSACDPSWCPPVPRNISPSVAI